MGGLFSQQDDTIPNTDKSKPTYNPKSLTVYNKKNFNRRLRNLEKKRANSRALYTVKRGGKHTRRRTQRR